MGIIDFSLFLTYLNYFLLERVFAAVFIKHDFFIKYKYKMAIWAWYFLSFMWQLEEIYKQWGRFALRFITKQF